MSIKHVLIKGGQRNEMGWYKATNDPYQFEVFHDCYSFAFLL